MRLGIVRLSAGPFLVCAVAMVAAYAQALDCPPCYPERDCLAPREKTEAECPYGLVPDICFCCCECAKGVNETCGGPFNAYGRCGHNSFCIVNSTEDTPPSVSLQGSGICEPYQGLKPGDSDLCPRSSPTPTPTPTPPSQTPTPTPACTSAPPDIPLSECRQKCSIEYCGDGGNQLCSAQDGLAFKRAPCRNNCQLTSCRACYFLLEPDCNMKRCPNPPTKRCLGKYYRCVRDFYRETSQLILKIYDPLVRTSRGRVICHVPLTEES